MGQRASYDTANYESKGFPPLLKGILSSEFSEQFVDMMRNRMIVSFYKYGRVAQGYPDRVDAIRSLKLRLEKYEATGNTEWLVDISNFAMIEFMHPKHELAHFRATDSPESPGRVRGEGEFDSSSNIPVDTAVEELKRKMNRSGD